MPIETDARNIQCNVLLCIMVNMSIETDARNIQCNVLFTSLIPFSNKLEID